MIAEITRPDTAPAATDGGKSAARVELRKKLEAFAHGAPKLEPQEAATRWLALLDEYLALPRTDDYRAMPEQRLTLTTVFESLPPPSSWKALSAAIQARVQGAKGQTHAEALHNEQLMAAALYLEGRDAELDQQLARLEGVTEKSDMGGFLAGQVRQLRVALARRAIDTPDELADFIAKSIKAAASTPGGRIEIDDWVTPLGPARAKTLIAQALAAKKVHLNVTYARDTRALVKAVVLEKVATLDVPPWDLVEGPDDLALFEALQKRFPIKAPARGAALFEAPTDERASYSLPGAKAAYALALVSRGRADDALAFSKGFDKQDWSAGLERCLPRTDLNQHGAAMIAFFEKVLERDPDAPVWGTYVSLALATGRGDALLSRLQAEREQRPRAMDRFRLDGHRAEILWALDRTDEAHALTKSLGETPPDAFTGDEKAELLAQELQHGMRLANIGRLIGELGWIDEGAAIAANAERQMRELGSESRSWGLCSLLASAKRFKQAERCYADEMRAELQKPKSPMGGGSLVLEADLPALAALYAEVGRHADVLVLVDQMSQWRGDDVAQLDNVKIPVSVAQAMLAAGRRDQAVALLKGLVLRNPGVDAPYEVLANTLGMEIVPWLDRVYARDQFEERPLIWKAYVLLRAGKTEEARQVAKQALRVDPTDGEQPPGDRERGFAVLADVLAAQGVKDEAERYRNIVKAVRVAERGDELSEAGLIKRSIEAYREGESLAQKAYCIHWRLAERLFTLGLPEEARKHYEIAFRYMPDQFGRVAHFCFGCQGVFEKDHSQRVADEVLAGLARSTPDNPRVFFLLGKLRQAQGRMHEAYEAFHRAIELDPAYLDALSEIRGLRASVLRPSREWDELQLKLIDVNPTQHAWNVEGIGDVKALWNKLAALQGALEPVPNSLYPFAAAKKEHDNDRDSAMRGYFEREQRPLIPTPGQAVAMNGALASMIAMIDSSRTRMW